MLRMHRFSPATLALAMFCLLALAPVAAFSAQTAPSPSVPKDAPAAAAPAAAATAPPIASPASGPPGAAITIKGKGFGSAKGTVKFNSTPVDPAAVTWGESAIKVKVPAALTPGKVTVTVTLPAGTSQTASFTVTKPAAKPVPVATIEVSPLTGAPGSPLKISGTGFGIAKGSVKFNGIEVDPAAISNWTNKEISVLVPSDLTPGSVAVAVTPSGGKSMTSSFMVTLPPAAWYGTVAGDFSPFFDNAGHPVPVVGTVLDQNYQKIGQFESSPNFTNEKMQIFYTQADPKAVPAYVLVGTRNPGDHLYPFTPTKPPVPDANSVQVQQVIMGDFCLPDKPIAPLLVVPPAPAVLGGQCTTGLLTMDTNTGLPVKPPIPLPSQIKAYVQAADGASKPAKVSSIAIDMADISFAAPTSFQPAWLVLETGNGAHTFAYTPAPPVQITDLVYTSDDLDDVCKIDYATGKPNCAITQATDLVAPLKPIASGAGATFVAAQGKLLVAQVRAPMGLEPTAILVANKDRHTSVIVRRTLKPGNNSNVLEVDLTPEDQTTMQRNYGTRIAKRYLGFTLNVKNPTAKKLQFRKSAVYFDVDYVEARGTWWPEFKEFVKTGSTLGMIAPDPYKAGTFTELTRAGETKPRVYRFGLEQNVKHSPLNYLSVLGSYDETTEKTEADFDTIQLLASIMNTIATGGIAGTGEFRVASSLLSGVFLPGLKGIVLNDSRINRHRANLVAQTLQDVVEVPPFSPVSTIVLLPRTGLLAFTDAEIPVMVQRVIDVHLEPKVITELTETPVEKGACKIGYTKDQARQALGEPNGLTTNADGSSVFTFSKGPQASASFNAGGSLVSCQARSNTDQLAAATTLIEMNTILNALGLSTNRIGLADGSEVLVDIPGVTQTFHFDSKGNKATDYKFLFDPIKAFETQTKEKLETFLQLPATALTPATLAAIKAYALQHATVKSGDAPLSYPSPDIANGHIVVTFKDATTIATITFDGDKPASVK